MQDLLDPRIEIAARRSIFRANRDVDQGRVRDRPPYAADKAAARGADLRHLLDDALSDQARDDVIGFFPATDSKVMGR